MTSDHKNMKRGLEEKKKKEIALGRVEFLLIPGERVKPDMPDGFDGYYEGHVRIFGSQKRSTLANSTMRMVNKNMVSCAPYFLMGAKNAFLDESSNTLLIGTNQAEDEGGSMCELVYLKRVFDEHDITYLAKEVLRSQPPLVDLACKLIRPGMRVSTALMSELPFLQRGGILYELSDMHRLSQVSLLYPYIISDRYDQKRQKRLYNSSTTKLGELVNTLKTKPWDLVWYSPPLHKGITRSSYTRALQTYGAQPPPHISYALTIYFQMTESRAEHKHTIFRRGMFSAVIPCMAREAREEMERQVYAYLTSHDVRLVGPDSSPFQSLAIACDYNAAVSACESLKKINLNSICKDEPETRGTTVPQIPPRLTARQTEIARYILHNWLTVVEGLPGTGKTALITWAFSHYSKVMLVSFVGMMVKSLQKRNGHRKEAACTIHHLLAIKKHNADEEAVDKWLGMFEVLIIDEFSNVSMSLFTKLLSLLPNVSKVIFVGDHRQLKPIDCGDPMGDILGAFGSHLLVDNLRVQPGLQPLQEAPRLITQNRAREIAFNPHGPISFVRKDGLEYKQVLRGIFSTILTLRNGKSVLNTHIVVLANNVRKAINYACEYVWNSLGIVKIPQGGGIRVCGQVRLYVGCKITFTKNYNQTLTREYGPIKCRSDPVANGELAVITAIRELRHPAEGIQMTIVDTEDKNDEPEEKQVWIHPKYGVHPMHVDLGYATTTYKTQGREFPYVIFWNQSDPREHWTRPNAYVAISRGKERVWCACEPTDFFTVCSQLDIKRRTVFSELLSQQLVDPPYRLPVSYRPSPLLSVDSLVAMPKGVGMCVPTLHAVVTELTVEREKAKKN